MSPAIECHNITEFKSHCLQILKNVHDKHSECLITKHGKPLVKVVAIEPEENNIFGCMKETGQSNGDIYSTGETWNAE